MKNPAEGRSLSTDQQSMASFATRWRKIDDRRRAEETAALILQVMAEDMLPVSTVKGDGFWRLMAFALM